jgi:hypothetical protein
MTAPAQEGAQLALELGTGFVDADVVVLVDGVPAWQGHGVTTNYSVGLADVVRVPLPAGTVPTVEVRAGTTTASTEVSAAGAAAGEVRLRCDLDPAGSMTIGPAPEGPWM